MDPSYPRLTVTPEEILRGIWCTCPACLRDGQHEPDCGVHEQLLRECTCGRTDQAGAAS